MIFNDQNKTTITFEDQNEKKVTLQWPKQNCIYLLETIGSPSELHMLVCCNSVFLLFYSIFLLVHFVGVHVSDHTDRFKISEVQVLGSSEKCPTLFQLIIEMVSNSGDLVLDEWQEWCFNCCL